MLNKEWVLMKVLLYLADGFEEIEALSTLDILRRADIDTTTVSIMGRIEVKSSRGVIIQADKVFSDIMNFPSIKTSAKLKSRIMSLSSLAISYNCSNVYPE